MTTERRQILDMLAEGKISAEEAERLLAALGGGEAGPDETGAAPSSGTRPKYIRVLVDTVDPQEGPGKVNIRIPIMLLRAGVKLTSLIPAQARDQMNQAMREHGVEFDVNQLRPEDLEELIDHLNELTVDVDQPDAKVKVFCE